ncbi:YncE family protein [Pseudomonas sp. FP2309]|uniref:YncE family protein n=1 Tax=Pseudomonas sp. FP2309 TaxID=2954091 RepID=UPI00273677C4|nr:hypothetical protein [Pseudomonas sp. FP2309]WLH66341.1 hypothetical protein PSH59_14400 [Pseudomonas sp. FP2309]
MADTPVVTADDYLDPPFVPYAVRPVVGATFGVGIRHIENSLHVSLSRWAALQAGDVYEVHVGHVMASGTVLDSQLDQSLFHLAIPREALPTGFVPRCYARVVRAGSEQVSTSEEQTWFIKDTRPGGVDKDPGKPFHSELRVHLPEDLQKPGVVLDPDRAAEGVICTIDPYPKMRVRDTIELFWNGYPVTLKLDEGHVNKTKPIALLVPPAVIANGGSGEVKIRFRVFDEVRNYSGELQQWSDAVRLDSDLDPNLLMAPYFLVDGIEFSDVNLDTQTGSAFAVELIVPGRLANGSAVPRNVQVVVKLSGVRADGTTLNTTLPTLISNPNRAAVAPVDESIIEELLNGTLKATYELQYPKGTVLGTSRVMVVSVYGTVTNMPAVSVLEADIDLIDPSLPFITVVFPDYTPYDANYSETLRLEGTRPGGGLEVYEQTLLAGAPPPPARSRTVPRSEFERFIGLANVRMVYQVDDGTDDDAQTFRESDAFYVKFGEPSAELPKALIQGVDSAGNLDPDSLVNQAIVTLPYVNTVAGDRFVWRMVGDNEGGSTGNAQSPIVLNGSTAGKAVAFPLAKAFIVANLNAEFRFTYTLIPADGGPVLRSEVLLVSVGMALGELRAPQVLEATQSPDELAPGAVVGGATVRVSFPRMAATDKIRMLWTGLAGPGSYEETKDGTSDNIVDFTVPPEVIGVSLLPGGRDISVQYFVIRNGQEAPSPVLTLRLLAIKPIPVATIENIGDREVLDVNQLTGAERTVIGIWRFIHKEQRMWMEYHGVNEDGSAYFEKTYTANLVTADGEAQGIMPPAPVDKLRKLKDGSVLTITFKVAYDRSSTEANAIAFPSRTYTVHTVPEFNLQFLDQPYSVGPNGRLDKVRLDAGSDITAPVKVTLTLPEGFSFQDGTAGSKEFTTDANGKLAIAGIKCSGNAGTYPITAKRGTSSSSAEIDVKRLLAAGAYTYLPGRPEAIALAPDNLYAYITIRAVALIAKVDLSSGNIVKEIDVVKPGGRLKVSPDGLKIYVASQDAVLVISVSEDRMVKSIPVLYGTYDYPIDFSPDGKYAAVLSHLPWQNIGGIERYSCNLNSIDTETDTVNKVCHLGYGRSAGGVYCTNEKIVYTLRARYFGVMRTNLLSGVTDVIYSEASTGNVHDLIISHDRESIYVCTHANGNNVFQMNMSTLATNFRSVNLPAPQAIAINSLSTLMVVWSFAADTYLVDLKSMVIIRRMAATRWGGAVFSPSEKYVYLCEIEKNRLSVVPVS